MAIVNHNSISGVSTVSANTSITVGNTVLHNTSIAIGTTDTCLLYTSPSPRDS